MSSSYQLKVVTLYNISVVTILYMLMSNFFDKEKYVPFYENLQLYLKLGFKLKNAPRIRVVYNMEVLKYFALWELFYVKY